jgi:amino acid permease
MSEKLPRGWFDGSTTIASAKSGGLRHSLKHRHMTMIALGGVIGAGLFAEQRIALPRTDFVDAGREPLVHE